MNTFHRSLTAFGLIGSLLFTSCAEDGNIRAAHTRGAVAGGGLGAIIGNNVSGIGSGEAIVIGAILGAIGAEKKSPIPGKSAPSGPSSPDGLIAKSAVLKVKP